MAWNVNNDLIKGNDLNLYLVALEDSTGGTIEMTSGLCEDAEVLAYATSASLEMNADNMTADSKLSCRWNVSLPGTGSYTVSSDALYCLASAAEANGAWTIDSLFEAMLKGKNIGWFLGTDKNAGDPEKCGEVGGLDDTKVFYWGEAGVSSLSITGNNGEITQSSISLTGSGAPHKAN